MSANELCVMWPAFFEARAELRRMQRELEGTVDPETFDQEFERMGG